MSVKLKLKKGDKVIVLTGKSKGTVGEILKIFPNYRSVTVPNADNCLISVEKFSYAALNAFSHSTKSKQKIIQSSIIIENSKP